MSSTVANLPPSGVEPLQEREVVYAGFWRRGLALLLDNVVMIAPMIVVAIGFLSILPPDLPEERVEQIAGLVKGVAFYLYYVILESSRWQGTAGKRILGLRVTDLSGERISFGRANLRTISKIPSVLIFGIGYLMAGFTQKKQGLHDMVAGCVVVREGRKPMASG